MTIRIIDHKKVDITDTEYKMYTNICRSYDDAQANRKGEDLFKDHFEVDNNGIIIFVKPPQRYYSSLEVFCFLISIMQNQHIRNIHKLADQLVEDTKSAISKLLEEKKSEVESSEK